LIADTIDTTDTPYSSYSHWIIIIDLQILWCFWLVLPGLSRC